MGHWWDGAAGGPSGRLGGSLPYFFGRKEIEKRKGAAPRSHDLTIARSHDVGARMQPHLSAALPRYRYMVTKRTKGLDCSFSLVLLLLHIHCCKKNPPHTYVRRGRLGGVEQEGEIHGSLLIPLLLLLVIYPMFSQSPLFVW